MAPTVGLLILAVVASIFMFRIPVSVSTDRTIQLSDEQRIQEFSGYLSKPLVKSPLKAFVRRPAKLFAYYKAVELAMNNYGRSVDKTLRLRQILDLKEDEHNSTAWFHLVFQEKNGGLREAISVVNVKLNVAKFSVKETEAPQESCDELSQIAKCSKCGYRGICDKGTAHIDPWLAFALKTQRLLQLDIPVNQVQMISAHNAFNARSEGYGLLDECPWPPPYSHTCLDLANQEFSFTDLLDMGVRGMEIDPWWCFGRMRMSHADGKPYLGCAPWDRLFEDGIQEIGEWVHRPENANEVVRLYFEDGQRHTQGHDDLINGPIAKYLGDKVLTPKQAEKYFSNEWPTPREMFKLNKTVFIAAAGDTHGGEFIYDRFWEESTRNKFVMSHSNCSNLKLGTPSRVYCDSTEYGPFWNGPKNTGVILDFSKFLKCGVTYPAADQVNPDLLRTAVFTWASGEPANPLTQKSCVLLSGQDERWQVGDCAKEHQFACVSTKDGNDWMVSSKPGPYVSPSCPSGFDFSVPHNGYQHQRLVQAAKGLDIWLNFTPYLSGDV